MRDALALGADRALLLKTDGGDWDPEATAAALEAIEPGARAGAINEERVREAAEAGAGTLAVACPFCTVMLDDGVKSSGRELRVADLATLPAESLEDSR